MAVSLDDLLPRLAGSYPGVPDPVLQTTLLLAANQFCRESGCWRGELLVDPPTDSSRVVDLFAEGGARISSLIAVLLNDRELYLKGDELYDYNPQDTSTPTAVALGESMDEFQQLVFNGSLSSGDSIQARVTYEPTLRSRTLPDSLVYNWQEALFAGVGMHVARDDSHNKHDERLAQVYEARFYDSIRKAKARARSGHTHARRVVRYGGI